jgi:hypothetical protein
VSLSPLSVHIPGHPLPVPMRQLPMSLTASRESSQGPGSGHRARPSEGHALQAPKAPGAARPATQGAGILNCF